MHRLRNNVRGHLLAHRSSRSNTLVSESSGTGGILRSYFKQLSLLTIQTQAFITSLEKNISFYLRLLSRNTIQYISQSKYKEKNNSYLQDSLSQCHHKQRTSLQRSCQTLSSFPLQYHHHDLVKVNSVLILILLHFSIISRLITSYLDIITTREVLKH